jgi:uncharacterized membrane protein
MSFLELFVIVAIVCALVGYFVSVGLAVVLALIALVAFFLHRR